MGYEWTSPSYSAETTQGRGVSYIDWLKKHGYSEKTPDPPPAAATSSTASAATAIGCPAHMTPGAWLDYQVANPYARLYRKYHRLKQTKAVRDPRVKPLEERIRYT